MDFFFFASSGRWEKLARRHFARTVSISYTALALIQWCIADSPLRRHNDNKLDFLHTKSPKSLPKKRHVKELKNDLLQNKTTSMANFSKQRNPSYKIKQSGTFSFKSDVILLAASYSWQRPT